MSFSLRPKIEQIPEVQPMYNVGALFDIPCGEYLKGAHDERILNGGLGAFTGFAGAPNTFKSTVMHHFPLTVMGRFKEAQTGTYDTEFNISRENLKRLTHSVRELDGEDVLNRDTGRWVLTSGREYMGNKWFEEWKQYNKDKITAIQKEPKAVMRDTPFLNTDGKSLFKLPVPTMTEVDSLTKFETDDVYEMSLANEIGESGGNTMAMRQGLAKRRLISEMVRPIAQANSPVLMTAHIGETIPMDARMPPKKVMEFMKAGEKMKGVTGDFLYLTNQCWQCIRAKPLVNNDKVPDYPTDTEDKVQGDTDLMELTINLLRNKKGSSGLTMQVVVSQRAGVLPELTEFHYCKTNKYGLEGNQQWYNLEFLPDVKLSRSTVRGKIEADARLRRALRITSELLQMTMLWRTKPEWRDLLCTPKELFEGLRAKGYDIDELLHTREWWTFNNDSAEAGLPFCSTPDLLRMNKGLYTPFWKKQEHLPSPAVLAATAAIQKAKDSAKKPAASESVIAVVDTLDDLRAALA